MLGGQLQHILGTADRHVKELLLVALADGHVCDGMNNDEGPLAQKEREKRFLVADITIDDPGGGISKDALHLFLASGKADHAAAKLHKAFCDRVADVPGTAGDDVGCIFNHDKVLLVA